MKLSKNGADIQRAIHDTLASGKALGGLLIGFAATVAGCRESSSPAHTMGISPNPHYQENAKNEKAELAVTLGEVSEPKPTPPQPKPNAVREQQGKPTTIGKMPLSGNQPIPQPKSNVVNEDRCKMRSVKGRFPSKK